MFWEKKKIFVVMRVFCKYSTGSVEDATEAAFNSFELRIDLDVAFHMHEIDLFNSAHVKFDVEARA